MLSGRTSCEQRVAEEVASIDGYNRKLNAFIRVFSGSDGLALSRARELDLRLRDGGERLDPGPLFGLPVTFKDNIFFGGFPTTNGSVFFRDFVPPINADIVDSLLGAGCIPVGKTNLHELALGVTGTGGYGGPIGNPVDPSRISGGSSGGSAVAVALSKGATASIGTDTGGSVRVPAALCGVCGFKPSQGLLSTVGVFPLSPSLDHLGLFTKTMPDMGLLFRALTRAKRNRREHASARRTMRIGVPSSFFTDDMDDEVSKHFSRTISKLGERSDVRVKAVRVTEDLRRYSRARGKITCKEGSWFYEELLRSPKAREGFHADVLALMDGGLRTGMFEYTRSLNLRARSIDAVYRLLSGGLDVLAMPTCLRTAPKIEEVLGRETGQMRSLLLRNTELFNMCGFPALSIPMNAGEGRALPTAIQLVGRFGEDERVVGVGERLWGALYPARRNQ
ncbi:MAG: amidase [Thaumarchaeota archaeon]|nr:amidase [Nitrososphaerota archaeon]